ncbi:hypothetical protein KUTeg_006710 [Tegillarca granosa]|uniref:Uncharacterized protein n=1 Tax=Tegillarca granosa TaxID=220873 RepID=A0ABQ9FE55_TEGGR|nr:hypothetical protein KUTeg_006710 [Tegillarca granosa]
MQSDIHDTSKTGLHPSFGVRAEDLPFMDLMSLSLRKQIIQDFDRDKGDREKVKDEVRLKRQLNHSKFTTAFGRYKKTMGQMYPQRQDELDQYEAIMYSMYNAYGSKAYEYHKIRGSWDKSRLGSKRSRFGTANIICNVMVNPIVSENLLINFVTFCHQSLGLKYSTIKLYVCGIRFHCLLLDLLNLFWDSTVNSLSRLHLAMNEIKLTDASPTKLRYHTTFILSAMCKRFHHG